MGKLINVSGLFQLPLPFITRISIKHAFPHAEKPIRPSIKLYLAPTESFFLFEDTNKSHLVRSFHGVHIMLETQKSI